MRRLHAQDGAATRAGVDDDSAAAIIAANCGDLRIAELQARLLQINLQNCLIPYD